MQELGTFVEECRVVLVALQNEMPALPEMEARAKVLRDSADQERGLHSRSMKNPRQHGSGCRFSVRAGDHQNFLPAQKFVMQQLWQRAKWNALVEQCLQFRISA